MNTNTIFPKRYSDADLAEFRTLLDQKLERAKKELNFYRDQAVDITDKISEDSDGWVEDAAMINDVEFLNDLAQRQSKYIRELEQALLRIQNKSYGICVLTGELIDKRRLLATPTTTKSLAAKNALQTEVPAKKVTPSHTRKKKSAPQVITKIIRKKPNVAQNSPPEEEEADDREDFYNNDDLIIDPTLDDIAEKYGYEEEYDVD